ncbi:gp254 [Bacillus phage W.Ph.]|uniref:Gp254 n=1 Tax=Bacillus phage W.Ph. TaxID=764595 RepID=G9B205_9CAUD|nr:gp254 [Bacillus phage W.Ph.]ADH03400.1 gp254 [Bacillus phage W.Ph.]
MLFKFIVESSNGKSYEFTKAAETMKEAERNIEQEAHTRGIIGELTVVERYNYELGGKWTSLDGVPYEDYEDISYTDKVLAEVIEQECKSIVEDVPEPLVEEEDGQFSLF